MYSGLSTILETNCKPYFYLISKVLLDLSPFSEKECVSHSRLLTDHRKAVLSSAVCFWCHFNTTPENMHFQTKFIKHVLLPILPSI